MIPTPGLGCVYSCVAFAIMRMYVPSSTCLIFVYWFYGNEETAAVTTAVKYILHKHIIYSELMYHIQ